MQPLRGQHIADRAVYAPGIMDGGPQEPRRIVRILYRRPGQLSDFPESSRASVPDSAIDVW